MLGNKKQIFQRSFLWHSNDHLYPSVRPFPRHSSKILDASLSDQTCHLFSLLASSPPVSGSCFAFSGHSTHLNDVALNLFETPQSSAVIKGILIDKTSPKPKYKKINVRTQRSILKVLFVLFPCNECSYRRLTPFPWQPGICQFIGSQLGTFAAAAFPSVLLLAGWQ